MDRNQINFALTFINQLHYIPISKSLVDFDTSNYPDIFTGHITLSIILRKLLKHQYKYFAECTNDFAFLLDAFLIVHSSPFVKVEIQLLQTVLKFYANRLSHPLIGCPIGQGAVSEVIEVSPEEVVKQFRPHMKQFYFLELKNLTELRELQHTIKVFKPDDIKGCFSLPKMVPLNKFLHSAQFSSLNYIQVTRIVREIIAAVTDLHNIDYVHGDIKPSNIVIDPNTGEIFLIDYHLTRKIKSTKEDDSLSGSIGYIHPTLLANFGKFKNISYFDAECFSLATVICQLYMRQDLIFSTFYFNFIHPIVSGLEHFRITSNEALNRIDEVLLFSETHELQGEYLTKLFHQGTNPIIQIFRQSLNTHQLLQNIHDTFFRNLYKPGIGLLLGCNYFSIPFKNDYQMYLAMDMTIFMKWIKDAGSQIAEEDIYQYFNNQFKEIPHADPESDNEQLYQIFFSSHFIHSEQRLHYKIFQLPIQYKFPYIPTIDLR